MSPAPQPPKVAVIMAGGVALGAYGAGAYAALHDCAELMPSWLAGSSIGAVNAALIAGCRREDRVRVLSEFWYADGFAWGRSFHSVHLRNAANWASAIQARLMGSPGFFHPRIAFGLTRTPPSLYDSAPMQERLRRLIDFERLNNGELRVSVAATDLETGDLVVFDTARGDRIEIEHLLASCGLLPEFAPVEIGGRMLGDGALYANAPVEIVLDGAQAEDVDIAIVLDLFARDGARPKDLQSSLARRQELFFGNQTYRALTALMRERDLKRKLAEAASGADGNGSNANLTVLYLTYRPTPDEAGPEKEFDFSGRTLSQRWQEGCLDMEAAIRVHAASADKGGIRAIRRS